MKKLWNEDEISLLESLYGQGHAMRIIAKKLNRSLDSVNKALSRYKLRLQTPRRLQQERGASYVLDCHPIWPEIPVRSSLMTYTTMATRTFSNRPFLLIEPLVSFKTAIQWFVKQEPLKIRAYTTPQTYVLQKENDPFSAKIVAQKELIHLINQCRKKKGLPSFNFQEE